MKDGFDGGDVYRKTLTESITTINSVTVLKLNSRSKKDAATSSIQEDSLIIPLKEVLLSLVD